MAHEAIAVQLDVALNNTGVEKYARKICGCGQLEAIRFELLSFEFWSVSDGGNLCPLWLVILKSV